MQEATENILKLDVYEEEFQLIFYEVLNKFVNEFDDMAYMDTIKQAQELLETINNY